MGEAEINKVDGSLVIHADIILYGNAASDQLAKDLADDISVHWNEPGAMVRIDADWYRVIFSIKGYYAADLRDLDVYENTDPRKNYFRIEAYVSGNISFVDGLNSNTGYFLLENLLNNSTTAAHEFGHTLGLDHPHNLDIRGEAVPGIMYPRGTLVDPAYQYDPSIAAGQKGGTLNPFKRKVLLKDIEALRLDELDFNEQGLAVLGGFTSVWHEAHLP